ncbi:hypothetical protein OROHE_004489 [Orobanche hederae]
MASTNYFKGVNLQAVKEQIIFSIVVDFESLLQSNFTEDMKYIVRNMKRNGIYNFLNVNPQHLFKEAVIAFYQEAEVTVDGITTFVEAPTLPGGQLDEEALEEEIRQVIIKENLISTEEQQFAPSVIKRKYGLLPVIKKDIGAATSRWEPPGGRSRRPARGRRIQ